MASLTAGDHASSLMALHDWYIFWYLTGINANTEPRASGLPAQSRSNRGGAAA
jgi:hypothetical protein